MPFKTALFCNNPKIHRRWILEGKTNWTAGYDNQKEHDCPSRLSPGILAAAGQLEHQLHWLFSPSTKKLASEIIFQEMWHVKKTGFMVLNFNLHMLWKTCPEKCKTTEVEKIIGYH